MSFDWRITSCSPVAVAFLGRAGVPLCPMAVPPRYIVVVSFFLAERGGGGAATAPLSIRDAAMVHGAVVVG
jgi:hypothetical protein